ncbi:MAG: OmpA family protein [Lautropia sp.]
MLSTKFFPLASLLASALLAGCIVAPVENGAAGVQVIKPVAPAPESVRLGSMRTHQYIRIDGEKNGILNAADDGRYTFIAFNRPAPTEVLFFDQEGKAVTGAAAGRVIALPRIFRTGVLVRIGDQDSYIAPNPRATSDDRPPLESDPEVVDARTRLELASTALPAFRLARERADATMRETRGGGPAATPAAMPAATYQVPALPALRPPAPNDPSYEVLSNEVLVRVFFASGGRAIVRPDDGLQRMEAEAADAREIRISGFTDNVGNEDVNAYLARQRAESIRELLIRRGVPAEKLFVSWTGPGRYLADNDTALGRAMNRRVEVTFVKPPPARAAAR